MYIVIKKAEGASCRWNVALFIDQGGFSGMGCRTCRTQLTKVRGPHLLSVSYARLHQRVVITVGNGGPH